MGYPVQQTWNSNHETHEAAIESFEREKRALVNWETIDYAKNQLTYINSNIADIESKITEHQKTLGYKEFNKKTGRETGVIADSYSESQNQALQILVKKKENIVMLISEYEKISHNLTREQRVEIVLHGHVIEASENNNEEIEWMEFDIPAAFLKDSTIMNALKEYGIITGDKVTLLNSNVAEKFNRFKGILNFVFDVDRVEETQEITASWKEELKNNYVFLINEWSKWLWEDIREMLTYRLAEAIYNDVTRMGWVIERKSTWKYIIVDWKTGQKIEGNTYETLLKDANTRNLLDVARIASMIDGNFVLNDHELVWDAPLVKHLLEEHAIADKTGKRIQKAELLLLDKDHVLGEINERIHAVQSDNAEGWSSAKATQELTFLKEYVTHGELDRQNYMRSILREVNHYRDFTEDNALIGSYTEAEIENMSDKDMVDIAADALRSKRPLIAVFGLLALFAKQHKLAFGAFTLAIFGWAIADWAQVWKRKIETVVSDDMLDLVKISDIRYSLDNASYSTKYMKLADVNNKFAEDQYDENNMQLPYLENKRLFEITEFITSNGIDVEIEDSANTTLNMLKLELSNLAHWFTDDELITYIKLIQKSDIQDSADSTLLDYLHEWLDPANRSYESVNFIGVVNGLFDGEWSKIFNQELNTIFRDAYEWVWDDRGERKDILTQRDEAKRKISSQKPIQARIDDVQSYLTDKWTMLEWGGTLSTKVHESLTAYKAYSEAENAIDGYTGIWDENVDVISNKIADALWLVDSDRSEQWKTSLSVNIDQKITNLETIKSEIPETYKSRPEFIALINQIDIVIAKLTDHNETLSQDLNIDRTSSMLPESIVISHFSDGANVARLDQWIEDDIEVLNNFMTLWNINIESLEGIQTEHKRLEAYWAYLANQTANHVNDRVKTHQTNILTNIDTFKKSDWLKATIESSIRESLTEKFAWYESMKTEIDNIDITDLDTWMQTIQKAEEFIKSQVSDTEILGNINVYSNGLDIIVNGLSSAWNQTKELWNNIKIWFGTLSLLNWNLDNLDELWTEFRNLRDSGAINQNVFEQAQETIAAMRQELEKIQGIDNQNRLLITKAQDIIWSDVSVSWTDITLKSIRESTIEGKNELKSSVEADIDSIEVSTLDTSIKRESALDKIEKVKKWFFDEASLMDKIQDIEKNINLMRPISEFQWIIWGADPDWITQDIEALDTQIARETDATKKDVLIEVRDLLDDIATNRSDITLWELHQELRNIIPQTTNQNVLWEYIENIETITTN